MNRVPHHQVEGVVITDHEIRLIVDGETHHILLSEVSSALAAADEIARQNYQISPSGYGIHWEDLDEDLSIDALLGVTHTPSKRPAPAALVGEPAPDYSSENPNKSTDKA